MVLRGLSEATGSWKTYWTLRASARGSRCASATRSWPSSVIAPAGRPVEADDQPGQRRLAAAGFADDAERLALAARRARRPARRGPPGVWPPNSVRPPPKVRPASSMASMAPSAIARLRLAADAGSARRAPRRARSSAIGAGAAVGLGARAALGEGAALRQVVDHGGRPSMASSRRSGSPSTGTQSISLRGVGMARRRQDVLGRPGLDDLAGIHHRDAVADRRDHAEIVGDEQDARRRARGAACPAATGSAPARSRRAPSSARRR